MLYSTQDKIECLKREILLRKKVYPNRVATHRMSQKQAYREIEIIQQILDEYEARLAVEEPELRFDKK